MLEKFGSDRVIFETDYPHSTLLDPGVRDQLVDVFGQYDHATRKQILQGNALNLRNLSF